jgi:hypothetical protein
LSEIEFEELFQMIKILAFYNKKVVTYQEEDYEVMLLNLLISIFVKEHTLLEKMKLGQKFVTEIKNFVPN